MCRFVLAVLPSALPVDELDAIARAHGRRLQPMGGSDAAEIRQDEAWFLTTPEHCDCDTPLGAWSRAEATARIDWSAETRKLTKKGWSVAKADKALAQKRAHAEDTACRARVRDEAAMASWIAFIAEILASGKASRLGLLSRYYSGAPDAPVALAGVEKVGVERITPEILGRMREDVLYLFQR